jgi:hypothetical protein
MVAVAAGVVVILTAGSQAHSSSVDVFPIPGARVASPSTQITFRGLPARRLGKIAVVGSKSGVHTGVLLADSDGEGGSFVPTHPFDPGERVTVSTRLSITGARRGQFSFGVATPAGSVPGGHPPSVGRTPGDLWHFVSRPDLTPAAVRVQTRSADAATGKVFVASQDGPLQSGPELLGPDGNLIYFKPLPKGQSATDFRAQTYQGHPVLTWWQGAVSAAGIGQGEDEIYDDSYRPEAAVRAGNGLSADLHEFELTGRGVALISADYPVYWDASSVAHASHHEIVFDAIVQAIDVPTGLVLYQWDSLDHVPVTASYQPPPTDQGHPWDYFHVNSIQSEPSGNLLISSRDAWAVYSVSRRSGATLWTLGGKHSSFAMGPNTRFAFQHDARLRPGNKVTLFDDGAGPPVVHKHSRGITLKLDMARKTAKLVRQDLHDPPLSAAYEGNVQRLANGDDFVGWGQQPNFTEYTPSGKVRFDARFVGAEDSYRAYRFKWSGTPVTLPAVAVKTSGGRSTLYVSWNGTTRTAKWRVLAGSSSGSLHPVATVAKTGFETAISLPDGVGFVAVQALDADGRSLGRSDTIRR